MDNLQLTQRETDLIEALTFSRMILVQVHQIISFAPLLEPMRYLNYGIEMIDKTLYNVLGDKP